MANLGQIGQAIGNGLQNLGTHTAQAAATANGISFASQAAQGAFNQASANMANQLATQRLAEQYGYNSAAAATQYAYNTAMWDKAAAWNEAMMQKQMEFNAAEAQKNRDWQQMMESTKYQRAIGDMASAGLNPILAVTGGGISAGSGTGATASTSAPQMSSAAGSMASGGVLNGISASEGNFTGQMEYMSGMLGLISAVLGGFSSAFEGLGTLGDFGEGLGSALGQMLTGEKPKTNRNPGSLRTATRKTQNNEHLPNVWETIPGWNNTFGWMNK